MGMRPYSQRLRSCYEAIAEYVDALGLRPAAELLDVSTDTVRRRVRAEQPWHFEEVLTLAMAEARQTHRKAISHCLMDLLQPAPAKRETHPLLLPSNLREVLSVVGRLTTEIADTLADSRVDHDEARRLLDLFSELDEMSAFLRQELQALLRDSS
jgi:hypothetical protein